MASVEILDIFLGQGLVCKLCRFDKGATIPVQARGCRENDHFALFVTLHKQMLMPWFHLKHLIHANTRLFTKI